MSQLAQGLPASAAGVEQVGGHALRELNPPQNEGDVVRVSGVVPQLDIVHQPANHRRVGGAVYGKLLDEILDGVINRAVGIAHQVKPQQARLKYSCHLGGLVLLRLHQQKPGVANGLSQLRSDSLQFCKGIPGGGQIGIFVLLHLGSPDYHALHQFSDGTLQRFQLLHCIATLRLPAHGEHLPLP